MACFFEQGVGKDVIVYWHLIAFEYWEMGYVLRIKLMNEVSACGYSKEKIKRLVEMKPECV